MIDRNQIPKLHEVYCRETGLHIALTMQRIYFWEMFLAREFTQTDLELVCRGMRKLVKDKKRGMTCLSFHRLIADLENFEELLAEYRALARRPKINRHRAEVLRATGRPVEDKSKPAQPVGSIVSRLLLADGLRKYRKEHL